MNQGLNYETINDLYDYIQKLVPAILKLSTKLRNVKDEDTLELLRLVVEGIEWSINAILLNIEYLKQNNIILDDEKIRDITKEFSEALTNKDLLLTADILEYEIADILTDTSGKIKSLLNK